MQRHGFAGQTLIFKWDNDGDFEMHPTMEDGRKKDGRKMMDGQWRTSKGGRKMMDGKRRTDNNGRTTTDGQQRTVAGLDLQMLWLIPKGI